MSFSLSKLKVFLYVLFVLFLVAPTFIYATPSFLVIDEFQISSIESGYDEYFKIKNYSISDFSLNGLSLRKITGGGTKYTLVSFEGFLSPGSSIVVAHKNASLSNEADYVYDNTSFRENSSVYIYREATKEIVDLVAFGKYYSTEGISYNEGTALENPGLGDLYCRSNGIDTDNNKADFSLKKTVVSRDPNVDKIVISELLPSPVSGPEWFELYNPTNLDISLKNLKICDAVGSTHCYPFPKEEVLLAGSHKVYNQTLTKITLNNTGDWLELYDFEDNLLTDSGVNYGSADKGVSLSLFGSEYLWTKTLTPGASNVFTDIIEEERGETKTAKSTKTKVTKVVSDNAKYEESEMPTAKETPEVKAADSIKDNGFTSVINHRTLGWLLILLAILLVVGYICWYFRDYGKNIYNKIRHRNDSTRF